MKKPEFTIVDYIIIIIIIAVIIFAFIHITSDDEDNSQESSSYDSSTLNKIVEKYLSYYNQGKIVKTTISGLNSTNNKEIEIHANIIWMGDGGGSTIKALIQTEDGEKYYAGLYKDFPNADIYLDKMSLEVDSEKYENLTEFHIKPENITSLSQLTQKIGNYSNYEISTTITVNDLDGKTYQDIVNNLIENHKRLSITSSNVGLNEQITITRGTAEEINLASNILGNIDGLTDDITIRVYNCTPAEQTQIENEYNVNIIKTY